MFIPDTPIKSASDDRLNRAHFAHKLSETIRDWNCDESIVIALYGPWGSGKTSILNLAIDHIYSTTKDWKDKKRPIIVRFNPWDFSAQTQLLIAFFQQLYAEIGKVAPDQKKELKKQFGKFVKTLSCVEALGDIPIIGKWIEGSAKLAGVFFPDQTLDDQRKDLIKLFRDINRRVIIVVDDIDRLTEQEIHQLFQLIKVNADFLNTIYLAAFDRQVVERALDTEQGVAGRDYLEKIVQVGFDIPIIETVFVERELFGEIDKILASAKIDEDLWDHIRWGNMYQGGIKPLFQSLRDVKRYINGLSFNLQILASEINPVDFIGLEALRIFIPEVYSAVAINKLLFTQAINLRGDNRDQGNLRAHFEQIFSLPSEDLREIGKNICLRLFPKVAQIYQPMFGIDYRQPNWRQARRICSDDVFDFYFTLGKPKGEISHAELELISQTANDPAQLLEIFRKLGSEGRFARLLDLLTDIRSKLDHEHALGLCQALLIIGDEFPNERRSFLQLDTDFQLALELYLMLQNVDPNERCQWLEDRIRSGQTIYMPVYVVWHDTPQEGKQRENPLFSENCHERLKRACVEQIEIRAQQKTLQNAKHLSLLIYRWKDWAVNKDTISEFIEFMISTQRNALDLLVGFLSQASRQSMSDYVGTTEWLIDIKTLGEFVDLQRLWEITNTITEDDARAISDQHWLALDAFRRELREHPAQEQ